MRYGRLEIGLNEFKRLLCLEGVMHARRLVTDIPDDTEIKTVYFDDVKQVVVFILCGSAEPFKKVPSGGIIPIIDLVYEDSDKIE